MSDKKYEMIPYISADLFPEEVVSYCEDHDIDTHCGSSISMIEEADRNAFSMVTWLIENDIPHHYMDNEMRVWIIAIQGD